MRYCAKKSLAAMSILALLLCASTIFTPRLTSANASGTGIIVSLYGYPGYEWQSVIQAKYADPSVPMMAVISPSSGPGSYRDSNFASGISQLESAGIIVIGYVTTAYGSIPASSVESEIYDYKAWYGISGVFFDQMWNLPGREWYYSSLSNYAHSIGMWITVGNPGTTTASSYIGTVNVIIYYENGGLPSISELASWTGGNSKSNFGMVSYGDADPGSWYVTQASRYVNWLYITNGYYPDPYTSLPSYFSNLASYLNSGFSSTVTATSSGSVAVTIKSATESGNSINGLWSVVKSSSGAVLASGYTPLSFYANPGTQYTLTIGNFGTYKFGRWSDGKTTSSITFSVSQSTTITAYYTTGSPLTTPSSWHSYTLHIDPASSSHANTTMQQIYLLRLQSMLQQHTRS